VTACTASATPIREVTFACFGTAALAAYRRVLSAG
jgi:hypothetical protein